MRRFRMAKARHRALAGGQGGLEALSRDELEQKAREAGLKGVISRYHSETIIRKLKEAADGTV